MAFTAKYQDLETLALNSVFQLRIAGAVENYAKFILGTTTSSRSAVNWAEQALANPQAVASQIASLCSQDPAFNSQTSSPIDPTAANVSDATLDTVVQTAINNSLIV